MNSQPTTVIVLGSVTRDRIRTHRRSVEQIGGAVWHAGTTFAQLGVRTRVVTGFSPVDHVIDDALGDAGIEFVNSSSTRTCVFVNDYTVSGADDRRQRVLALADPIYVDGLSQGLEECDLAYLGPLHPDDISDRVLALMTEMQSLRIALDVQGFTRVITRGSVGATIDDRLFALLPRCEVIKANRSEATLLTGSTDPSTAVMRLRRMHAHLESMVTCGSEGVYVAARNDVYFQPAISVGTDDPTGAGDIFFAAYLTQRLRGASVKSAARFAADFTAQRLQDPTRRVLLTAP